MKTFFRTLFVSASLLAVASAVRWLVLVPEATDPSSDVVIFSFHPQVEASPLWAPPVEDAVVSTENHRAGALEQKSPVEKIPNDSIVKTESLTSVLQVNNPEHLEYVVEAGDRLDKISMKFYGTHHRHKEILAANPGLDPRRLRPGIKLIIPDIRSGLPVQPVVYVQRSEPLTKEYVVQKGDVLGVIAQNELGSSRWSSKILEVNPGLNPLKIQPGQVIHLPVLGLNQNK